MAEELTNDEKVFKAFDKAIKTHTGKDGLVHVRVGIKGDGRISKGGGRDDLAAADEVIEVNPDTAMSLSLKGFAEPVAKPKG